MLRVTHPVVVILKLLLLRIVISYANCGMLHDPGEQVECPVSEISGRLKQDFVVQVTVHRDKFL